MLLKRLIEIGIDARGAKAGGAEAEAAVKKVTDETRRARDEMGRFVRSGEGMREVGREAKDAARDVDKLEDEVRETARAGESLGDALAGIFGGITLGLAVRQLVRDFQEFEEALIDVQNTTGLTGRGIEQMGDEILALTTRLPVGVQSVASLVSEAKRLGNESTADMLKFAEAMERVGAATDLQGGGGARAIGQLLATVGSPANADNILKIGGAVNALADAFGGSHSEIVANSTGIANLTARYGVGATQALAFSAALGRMGVESGNASLAINKLFDVMTDKFVQQFGGDRVAAFQGLLRGLAQVKAAGGDVEAVLTKLGFENDRVLKTVLPLISGQDQLAKALRIVGDESGNVAGLLEGSDRVFGSTAKQVELLWNNVKAVGVALGRELLPVVNAVLGVLNSMLGQLYVVSEGAGRLTASGKLTAIAMAGLGAGLAYVALSAGPIVAMFSKFGTVLGTVAGAASSLLIPALTVVAGILASLMTFDFGYYLQNEFKVVADAADAFVNQISVMWTYIRSSFELGALYIRDTWSLLFNTWLREPFAAYIQYFAEGLEAIRETIGLDLGGRELLAWSDQLARGSYANDYEERKSSIIKQRDSELEQADAALKQALENNMREFGEDGRRTGEGYAQQFGQGLFATMEDVKQALASSSATVADGLKPVQEGLSQENVDSQGALDAADAVKKLAEAINKGGDETQDAAQALNGMFAALRLEKDLIGKTNDERERAEAAVRFQAIAAKAYKDDLDKQNTELQRYLGLLQEVQRAQREHEVGKTFEDMDKQIRLLRESNFEREHATEIAKFQALAEEAYGEATSGAQTQVDFFIKKLHELERARDLQRLAEDIGKSFGSAFEDVVFQTKSVQEAIEDMVREVARLIFQELVTKQIAGFASSLIMGLAGGFGGSNRMGGAFVQGTQVAFASGYVTQGTEAFPMSGGRYGIRGEAGPEGVLPLERGSDGRLGVRQYGSGGGQTNVTMNVYGVRDVDGFRRSKRQLARSLKRATR